jgi:hypothetical protein
MKEPGGKGYMKGGGNDLIVVLRIQQRNGKGRRHVRSVQVVGNIRAGLVTYMGCFTKGDGTESEDQIEADYVRRKPFFRLSWIVFPQTPIDVDLNDETYGRFTLTSSNGAIGMPAVGHSPGCDADVQSSFGFEDTGKQPKYPIAYPTWSHLIEFQDTNPSDLTGRYPKLRNEVVAGKVKIQVNLDGEVIDISPKNIKLPWSVSLDDREPQKMITQNLFYGIDNSGNRMAYPTPNDPLVKK